MTTTYTAFTPSPTGAPPFSFQPTLAGQVYTVSTAWNFAAQRWYLELTDPFGVVVVNCPLVGSPARVPLSSLSWSGGVVTAIAPGPLGYRVGSSPRFSIGGATPAALNGTFSCTVLGATSFSYALAADPGSISAAGSYSADVNLVAAYVSGATLVYRPSTGNFEVGP